MSATSAPVSAPRAAAEEVEQQSSNVPASDQREPAGEESSQVAVESQGDPIGKLTPSARQEDAPPAGQPAAERIRRVEHPSGEEFFHAGSELSEAEAERIARGQLSRAGLLRGQRVRVGD